LVLFLLIVGRPIKRNSRGGLQMKLGSSKLLAARLKSLAEFNRFEFVRIFR